MAPRPDLAETLVPVWRTTNQVTAFLVGHLSPELWRSPVPGAPRRTVGMIAGHIHNARCTWIKTLGREHGIPVPEPVDRRRATPRQVLRALGRSSRGIVDLLTLGCAHGGRIPPSRAYAWRNLPLDVGHVLAYFVAHEGHHRGQVVMIARELGHRLPVAVTGGLWQWTRHAREARR